MPNRRTFACGAMAAATCPTASRRFPSKVDHDGRMALPMKLPHTPSFRLDGRRALVTGASSGIGLGCAVALAEQGAQVFLAARSLDRLAEAAEALRTGGFDATTVPMDVADVAATAVAIAELGPFDILVNSAGLARHAPAA